MKKTKLVLLPVILTVLTACSPAVVKRAELVNVGTYSSQDTYQAKAESVIGGVIQYGKDVVFTSGETRVPARKGEQFGLQYVLYGEPSASFVTVTEILLHPTVIDPTTGITRTKSSRQKEIRLGYESKPNMLGYGFDHDWEVVPGEWIFQVAYQGEIVVEQAFTVYEE